MQSFPVSGRLVRRLSRRECQVLRLITLPNKEIAVLLGISPGTVKKHVSHLLRQLRATNRTQLYAWGMAHPEALSGRATVDGSLDRVA
jgi:DNA-binding NarL/FixJ family response regulator